jgi:hypothetical protein
MLICASAPEAMPAPSPLVGPISLSLHTATTAKTGLCSILGLLAVPNGQYHATRPSFPKPKTLSHRRGLIHVRGLQAPSDPYSRCCEGRLNGGPRSQMPGRWAQWSPSDTNLAQGLSILAPIQYDLQLGLACKLQAPPHAGMLAWARRPRATRPTTMTSPVPLPYPLALT